MALRIYEQPITELCLLNTRESVMIGADPDTGISMQLTNEHRWEEERLDDGLDDSPFTYTSPSLWDE